MEFYGIHSEFAQAIQDKVIIDFKSFISNFLNVEKVPIPHDYKLNKEKINKGDLVFKLNGSGDLAIKKTEEFIKTIEYLNFKFITVISKTLDYTDKDEIHLFIFTQINQNKFEQYPPIREIFQKSIWGDNYFIKKIEPIKNELKDLINRNFVSKRYHFNETRAKWSFRLSWAAIALSILSLIISTYFNYQASKAINTVKILDTIQLKNDTLNIEISKPVNLKTTKDDSIIVEITTPETKGNYQKHKQVK